MRIWILGMRASVVAAVVVVARLKREEGRVRPSSPSSLIRG